MKEKTENSTHTWAEIVKLFSTQLNRTVIWLRIWSTSNKIIRGNWRVFQLNLCFYFFSFIISKKKIWFVTIFETDIIQSCLAHKNFLLLIMTLWRRRFIQAHNVNIFVLLWMAVAYVLWCWLCLNTYSQGR